MKIPRRVANGNVKGIYVDGNLFNLLSGFKKAVDSHNTSAVIVVDGRSGMGKTTLSNQLSVILDPDFNLNKVHYSPTTFLEGGNGKIGLANAKAGDCILFDEAMLISNRSALSQINRMIIQAMSMIRSKRLYIIFCVNSIFDLDRNLAISRADLLLHVYGQTLIDRGRFSAFFRGRDGQDRIKQLYIFGKKLYSYGRPKANLIGSFTKEFIVDEKEYEKQKQLGVNAFLKGSEGTMTQRAYHTRNALIKHLVNKENWNRQKIMEITELSKGQLSQIINNGKKNSGFSVL